MFVLSVCSDDARSLPVSFSVALVCVRDPVPDVYIAGEKVGLAEIMETFRTFLETSWCDSPGFIRAEGCHFGPAEG